MNGCESLQVCPYCEYRGLFQAEEEQGTWRCGACERSFVFSFVQLLGLVALGAGTGVPDGGH